MVNFTEIEFDSLDTEKSICNNIKIQGSNLSIEMENVVFANNINGFITEESYDISIVFKSISDLNIKLNGVIDQNVSDYYMFGCIMRDGTYLEMVIKSESCFIIKKDSR